MMKNESCWGVEKIVVQIFKFTLVSKVVEDVNTSFSSLACTEIREPKKRKGKLFVII